MSNVSPTASPGTVNEQACSFSVSGEAVGETLDNQFDKIQNVFGIF